MAPKRKSSETPKPSKKLKMEELGPLDLQELCYFINVGMDALDGDPMEMDSNLGAFGADLSGEWQVEMIGGCGDGSFFARWPSQGDAVVFVDSEYPATVVATSLENFWDDALTLLDRHEGTASSVAAAAADGREEGNYEGDDCMLTSQEAYDAWWADRKGPKLKELQDECAEPEESAEKLKQADEWRRKLGLGPSKLISTDVVARMFEAQFLVRPFMPPMLDPEE
eukprot:TRINITY_DN681_c0_g1_i2.p1 TRINITY_DN681_c0_g1~~TRINITY_DN681_c0_g1_i2.p1  ORF type:complete len:225 (-),score=50.54 TRINITY_DN681_c0_g1_i2:352-1026(-)